MLVRPAGNYLEGNILIRIHLIHIGNHLTLQLLEALVRQLHLRADAGDAEHMLQRIDRLIIIIGGFRLHIDTSADLADRELTLYGL